MILGILTQFYIVKIGIKTTCYMHGQIYENYKILFKNQPNVYSLVKFFKIF